MKRRQSEHEIAPPVSAFCHSVTVVLQCDRMSAGANQFRDGGHKGKLTDKNFDSRFIERKPTSAVDLGKGLNAAAAGRPFQLKAVRCKSCDIEIGLKRKGGDVLAALL